MENGEEALAAVEAVGGGNGFHLVLMDLHMPIMVSCLISLKNKAEQRLAKQGPVQSELGFETIGRGL